MDPEDYDKSRDGESPLQRPSMVERWRRLLGLSKYSGDGTNAAERSGRISLSRTASTHTHRDSSPEGTEQDIAHAYQDLKHEAEELRRANAKLSSEMREAQGRREAASDGVAQEVSST
ncbi:hypothetical protein, partial [Brevibacterium renqingii]|uniref:hypothetical protein n=1 Tax=Brevibacterium renqingii TaxID=2776916 RepID=UPI001AE0D592